MDTHTNYCQKQQITPASIKAQQATQPNHPNQQANDLMPFVGYPRESMPKACPYG